VAVRHSDHREYEASPRFALVAPRGTPEPVIRMLNAEVAKALDDAELKRRFGAVAMELTASAPDAVTHLFAAERARWAPLIKAKGIRLDP